MEDFFKYLAPGDLDKEWGLYLNVAGHATIPPGIAYPPSGHPSGYYFTWEQGRILDEYQINYITEGTGVYETKKSRFQIKPGTLLITKPGVWHRYKPREISGWTENYVGFSGNLAGKLISNSFFTSLKPVLYVGNRGEFIDTYLKIFEYIQAERPGYQQVSAGMVMKLLGYIVASQKLREFSKNPLEQLIQKSCLLIRENVDGEFDLKLFAETNMIGYSNFRRLFKKYTGLPPLQYQLDLKIMRSRELLLTTDKTIKEISFHLGFQSVYYFSRAFKKKTGISPTEVRKKF
jgi:AraC-like DNA-binding protein